MSNEKIKFDPFVDGLATEDEKQKFFNMDIDEAIKLKKEYDDAGRKRYKFLNKLFNSQGWVESYNKYKQEKDENNRDDK